MNYPAVCCNTLLVLAVSLANFAISAETRELLKPVEKNKAEKIIEYNGRDVEAGLFFAKRYRIVEVNSDLLFDDKEFSITLFEDRKIRVKRRKLNKTTKSGYVWQGIRVSPEIDAWDPELSPEKLAELRMNKEEFKDSLFSFELYITQAKVDPMTGEAHLTDIQEPEVPSQELLINDVNHAPGLKSSPPIASSFRSVNGNLPLPLVGNETYHLLSLPYTPKYHLIYEEDPENRPIVSMDGGEEFDSLTETIEQWRNGQEYARYLETLPPRENKMVRGEVE